MVAVMLVTATMTCPLWHMDVEQLLHLSVEQISIAVSVQLQLAKQPGL